MRDKGRIDTTLLLAVHLASFLRTHEKLAVARVVKSERFFCSLGLDDLAHIVGRPLNTKSWNPEALLTRARAQQTWLESSTVSILAVDEEGYPPQLREIYDPPFLIFLDGILPDPDRPLVAIVGTRRPTARASAAAKGFAADTAHKGLVTVSGLARGIDGAAHRGSLEAGGATIAVLGCGIDEVYPASHRSLASRIQGAGGALISEYGPGVTTKTYHFPARNRIISGLSRWVLIVEAPERSGALITADYALDQGRELCVHAVGLRGVSSAGTAALARDGAPIVEGCDDLFDIRPVRSAELFDSIESSRPGFSLAESLAKELGWELHEGVTP